MTNFGALTGSTEVLGPNLYAADNGKLLINSEPNASQEDEFTLKSNRISFLSTREIDDSWYPVSVNMKVRAKLLDSSDPSTDIETGFYYTNDSSGSLRKVCGANPVTVDSSSYSVYTLECSGGIDGPVKKFYYRIANYRGSDVNITAKGDTRVEVRGQ